MRLFKLIYILFFVIVATFSAHAQEGDENAIKQVISNQLQAFRAKDADKAYQYADPSIKSMFPSSAIFMNMVKRGYNPIYQSSSYQFGKIKRTDKSITQEVTIIDELGNTYAAIYEMQKQEDGSWKIKGVFLNKDGGLAA